MKDYHFIGIKGSGMSALAQVLSDMEENVQGSDIEKTFFTQKPLEKRGIPITLFDETNIKKGQTIISSPAYKEDNVEVAKAKQEGIPVHLYPHFLGSFIKNFTSVAVTGSHGKTTTTGLLSYVMEGGKPTSYLIGDGTGKGQKNSEYFVFEACEYRRHFLNYYPDYVIMTNVDFDHPDYFKNTEDVFSAFQEMANQVNKKIIACGEDVYLNRLTANVPIVYYGFNKKHDFYAHNINTDKFGTHFDVSFEGEFYGSFTIPGYGSHHILNSLGVLAICHFENVEKEIVKNRLASFGGVKRRFNERTLNDQILIDDYAHHPTEIAATIESARKKYDGTEITAIFQPHTFSRTKAFLNQFAEELAKADYIYLCDIFSSAREKTSELTIEDLKELIPNAQVISEKNMDVLQKHSPGVLLFMGAGDIQKYLSAYVSTVKA